MNRDNVLFLVIGALTGFIAGYVMHEAMAARQPAPRNPAVAAQNMPAPPGARAGAGPAAAGPQAAMEQVQLLRKHVEQNPDDAEAVRQLANLNYEIRNWQRAADLYQQYLGLVPDDVDVIVDLGATYRFMGQPQEALARFRRIRELDPEHWRSRYNEVLVLALDLGELDSAITAMEELQALQPDNQDVARLAAELQRRRSGG